MSEWKEEEIGKIPEDAKLMELGNCIDLIIDYRGKTPKKLDSDWTNEGIRTISAKNVHKGKLTNIDDIRYVTYDVYKKWMKEDLQKGDCLVASEGATLGEHLYWDFDFPVVLGQRLFCIRTNPKIIDSKYFYAFVTSNYFQNQIHGRASGTSVFGLRQTEVLKMLVPIIPIERQIPIGKFHYTVNKKIDLLERQNATLEAMAETLFRQWFVEPGKKILNEGAVIEGFENAKFEKWIIETVCGEWGKENIEGEYTRSVYCIRGTDIADLNTGIPLKTPIRFIKETKFRNIEPREGDLIIEISGGTETQSTGRVCYINKDIKGLFNKPLVFSNFCRMIRVRRFEFAYFLYCYIQYLYNQDEFFNLENGSSGIKNLNYKALLFELEYPMPNEELVIKFHERVESLFKKINQNKTQTITLTALRDTLLPKLMSGEVRIN